MSITETEIIKYVVHQQQKQMQAQSPRMSEEEITNSQLKAMKNRIDKLFMTNT